MAKHRVFVYGTLKKGQPNYNWMLDYKEGQFDFIGNGRTASKYPLVIGTKYNIPFLLDSPGQGHQVHGEVYEVDDQMLFHLDELEDHPNFYVREEGEIIMDTAEKVHICWVYLMKTFRPDLLKLPCLENYKSEGPHGLTYCERNNEATMEDLLTMNCAKF